MMGDRGHSQGLLLRRVSCRVLVVTRNEGVSRIASRPGMVIFGTKSCWEGGIKVSSAPWISI